MLEFFPVDYDDVYTQLTNNDRLMKILDEKELLLKEEMLFADYDKTLLDFMKAQLKLDNIKTLQNLSKLLVDNENAIISNEMSYLIEHKTLFKEIKTIFGEVDIDEETYREIFYCYKYCYTSSFFQNNTKYFIPEYDLTKIEDNEVLAPFMDAINKEFDKLDYCLNATRKYISFDEIPYEFINYLGQLFGYEKKDIYSVTEERHRELLKNIIDIYRIKGTNYSFELFFSFLGFTIEISEYYFDRRMYYRIDQYNEDRATINKEDYEYYLVKENPANNFLQDISVAEAITRRDFSPQYSLLEFNDLVDQYGAPAVLGYSILDKNDKAYNGKVFKYFKSNYVYYKIGLRDRNPTQDETLAIAKYLEFLTPVFIAKKILIIINLGTDEEDNIRFDGDGKGNGDKLEVLPDDFEMLDSEDWAKYNNDGRTHDGIISETQDSQYKTGERFPIVARIGTKQTTRYDNIGNLPDIQYKRLLHWFDAETNTLHYDHNNSHRNENPSMYSNPNYMKSYGHPETENQIEFWKSNTNNVLDYDGPNGKNIDDWVKWNANYKRVDFLLNEVEKDEDTLISTPPDNPISIEDYVADDSFNELEIIKSTNLINSKIAEFTTGFDYSHLYKSMYQFTSYDAMISLTNGHVDVNTHKEIVKYNYEGCIRSVVSGTRVTLYKLVPQTLYTSGIFNLDIEETTIGWDPVLHELTPIETKLSFISQEVAIENINAFVARTLDGTEDYYIKEKKIEDFCSGLVYIQSADRYFVIRKKILASGFVQVFPHGIFANYNDAATYFNTHPEEKYNFRLFFCNEDWYDPNTHMVHTRGYYRFAYKNRKVNKTFYDDMTAALYTFDKGIRPQDIVRVNYKGRPYIYKVDSEEFPIEAENNTDFIWTNVINTYHLTSDLNFNLLYNYFIPQQNVGNKFTIIFSVDPGESHTIHFNREERRSVCDNGGDWEYRIQNDEIEPVYLKIEFQIEGYVEDHVPRAGATDVRPIIRAIVERPSYLKSQDIQSYCKIYEYDPNWKGYSEEHDEEDLIFYNNPSDATLQGRYYTNYTDRHYIDYYNIHNYIYRPVFEIEERNFNELTDGAWMLEQILTRSVETFSYGELDAQESIGGFPYGLIGILEDTLEEINSGVHENTLRQYYNNVSKFMMHYYRYLIVREELPEEDTILSQILGEPVNGVYSGEKYYEIALDRIIHAVYRFIVRKIEDVLPRILNDAIENYVAEEISRQYLTENVNNIILGFFNEREGQPVILDENGQPKKGIFLDPDVVQPENSNGWGSWDEDLKDHPFKNTYGGNYEKDYIDIFNESINILNERIVSKFSNYIDTFINSYADEEQLLALQSSNKKYIDYVLQYFNSYYTTFLTQYHEFLALAKLFRQQVNEANDPNLRYAVKYYLISTMYQEKLALYREKFFDDNDFQRALATASDIEYIYYAPKAEFNGQSGKFNLVKMLEISKDPVNSKEYSTNNLPFYGFLLNSGNFILNASFYVKISDFVGILGNYYDIQKIYSMVNSQNISDDDKAKMKENILEAYSSSFTNIIPTLFLNEVDFSRYNQGTQLGIAENARAKVFNQEINDIVVTFNSGYIIFTIKKSTNSDKVNIPLTTTLKDYPIGYLRINYIKQTFNDNIISVPYRHNHNWMKLDSVDTKPYQFKSLGAADRLYQEVKNKILTEPELFQQYESLGTTFTGLRDIVGVGEDGNQYVNKVKNLYEKNYKEFIDKIEITTKNLKHLNIKKVKLYFIELYKATISYINFVFKELNDIYTYERLDIEQIELIYKALNKICTYEKISIEYINLIFEVLNYITEILSIKINIKNYIFYRNFKIIEYLRANASNILNKYKIEFKLLEKIIVKTLEELNLLLRIDTYTILEEKLNTNTEMFKYSIDDNVYCNYFKGNTVNFYYHSTLFPMEFTDRIIEMINKSVSSEFIIPKIATTSIEMINKSVSSEFIISKLNVGII